MEKIIKEFDKELFIKANLNVDINSNRIIEDIRDSKIQFHLDYKPFNEEKYLEKFQDVAKAVKAGDFQSAFEHFCLYGYKEIISGNRDWDMIKQQQSKSPVPIYDNVYGFIEAFEGIYIWGWAGYIKDIEDIKVQLVLEQTVIAETIADISRQDVKESYHKFKYAKGFEAELKVYDFLSLIKDTDKDRELSIQLMLDSQTVHTITFTLNEFFYTLSKQCTNDNFLTLLPFIGYGLEDYLSLEQLIDVLYNFDTYGLNKSLISQKAMLVSKLFDIDTSEDKEDKLLYYLTTHHDVLAELVTHIDKITSIDTNNIVSKALNSIDFLEAWHILLGLDDAKKIYLDLEDLYNKVSYNEEIKSLAKNPNQILDKWNQLEASKRIEYAFKYIGLLVFLQEYDKLKLLNLSIGELSKVCHSQDKLSIETLVSYWLDKGAEWESMLMMSYLVSVGIREEQFRKLADIFISKSKDFRYLNTSALKYILDRLFVYDDINLHIDIMYKVHEAISTHNLWSDDIIKQIYTTYTNLLLDRRDYRFDEVYKGVLYHYILEDKYQIDMTKLSERYMTLEHIQRIRQVENYRLKAMKLLFDGIYSRELLMYLKELEYLAPELIGRVIFEISKTSFNFNVDEVLLDPYHIGSAYDNMLVAKKLQDEASAQFYETKFINTNIENFHTSYNNFWYKQALSLRTSKFKKRKEFLEELYSEIIEKDNLSDEDIRLVRLLCSEFVWSIIQGVIPDDIKLQNHSFVDILDSIESLDSRVLEYTLVLRFYLDILQGVLDDISLDDIDYDFESRERLSKLIKLDRYKLVTKQQALSYIEQYMVFPYTMVMIYSCQAYMDTRQQVIRDTWLQRLKSFGIGYKFIVGGVEYSKVDGDIVYLAVDDTYEKLPQKSVEMFNFVHKTFSYERYMKLDDDCFLNVDAYFCDDVLYTTDYYGRSLYRGKGMTDRVWHQKKSSTNEAKNAIDLSPEPSLYADGSTGYVLSRYAIENLYLEYTNKQNISLIGNSFMEDKLVGDLLSKKNIQVSSPNFSAIIYRKLTDKQEATFWEYNVWPKSTNSVKVLHCETSSMMQKVWEYYDKPLISHQVQPVYYSNRPIIHLRDTYDKQPIIEEIKVDISKIKEAKHIAVVVCQNELLHLPALLKHHRDIGIEHFIYIDNVSTDDSLEYMMAQDDVSVFASTQMYKNYRFSVDWLEVVFANFCYGKWVLVIDADELFVYDDFEHQPITVLTDYADKYGYDSFLAPMIDMYSQGKLSQADIKDKMPYEVCNYFDSTDSMDIQTSTTFGPFSNSVVYAGGLRSRVFGSYNQAPAYSYLNQKYCLFKYKPVHKFIEGIHFMGNNNPAPIKAGLLHFKYHAGFFEKVQQQIQNGQHWNGSKEYKRYLKVLENNPEITLYDKQVSKKYIGSVSLVEADYISKVER